MFNHLLGKGFQIQMLHHAEAILRHDMAEVENEIESVLSALSIPVEEIVRSGGGEGAGTQRMRRGLADDYGWHNHSFEVKKIVDGVETESTTHTIDHVRRFPSGICALELEWNNKDPFFDRDLENFKRLHADGVISVGAIVTRGSSLQAALKPAIEAFAVKQGLTDILSLNRFYEPTSKQKPKINRAVHRLGSFPKGWAHAFVNDKFGTASTHWSKLQDRVARGVGNPCPLLLIGIPDTVLI